MFGAPHPFQAKNTLSWCSQLSSSNSFYLHSQSWYQVSPPRDEGLSTIPHQIIQNNAALVHYQAGISRSASIVISYLMKHHNITLKDAYDHTKSERTIFAPNIGFMQQLVQYGNGNMSPELGMHHSDFGTEMRAVANPILLSSMMTGVHHGLLFV
eukprot:GEZU01014898.1.p1 GENE.GEZU01014898.1~~GEZU01014898.1.p1  ORF type:complete len:155 (+),score=2.64 GEZU01014898.1:267-731(+)